MSTPWILLHGAGGGAWEWVIWERLLRARGQTVTSIDLQPDAAGLAATELADYRRQCLRLLRQQDRPAVVVGASMGARLALQMQAEAPGAIAALVLVNPVPLDGLQDATTSALASNGIRRWSQTRLASTQENLPDADIATVHFAQRRWRDESLRVLRALQQPHQLEPPSCPCLVFVAEHDQDIDPQHGRALARWCQGDLTTLVGTSHVGALLGRQAGEAALLAIQWSLAACSPTAGIP